MLDVKQTLVKVLSALTVKKTMSTTVSGVTLVSNDVFRCGNVVRVVLEARGSFSAGSYKTVAQLPHGYRPSKPIVKGVVPFGNTTGYLNIDTSGNIRVYSVTNLTVVYIDETFIVGGVVRKLLKVLKSLAFKGVVLC